MKNQACFPCAKRKVRCDHQEPRCSNCKRRKTDTCHYPDSTTSDYVKQLEETVRRLRGDVTSEVPTSSVPSPKQSENNALSSASTIVTRVASPLVENGNTNGDGDAFSSQQQAESSIYVESRGWQSWINSSQGGSTGPTLQQGSTRSQLTDIHTPGKHLSHAFNGSPWRQRQHATTSGTATGSGTDPGPHGARLWAFYIERAEPFTKITFEWTLEKFEKALGDTIQWGKLNAGEQILVLAQCLYGCVTTTNQECLEEFGKTRTATLDEYREYCEDAFTKMNVLAIEDIFSLKALCLYIKASLDTVTSRSLWSLMGLVCRSAEQMGLHRDGQALGLSLIETEDRRRLWWQMQHVEMVLAVKCGLMSLYFTASWDTKLPLNVDDSELQRAEADKKLVEEVAGLTKFSLTLFSYWIIAQQREFRQKCLDHPEPVDKSFLGPLTDRLISGLEAGVNLKFLQYCDPIQPIHALLQISARAVICVLRLRALHEMRLHMEQPSEKLLGDYFDTCIQSLSYVAVTYSHPLLRPFRWLAEVSFGWHAFVGLLADIPQLTDVVKLKRSWTLLADLYDVIPFLKELPEDRRREHAARSVILTWHACKDKRGLETMRKPAFVTELETSLALLEGGTHVAAAQHQEKGNGRDDAADLADRVRVGNEIVDNGSTDMLPAIDVTDSDIWQMRDDLGDFFNFNFADINWSFWDSID